MSNTPETDAFRDSQFTDRVHEMDKLYDLAEKLERELDEAREIARDLAVIASHCLGSHTFSLSETSERIADTLKRWRELKQ